MLAPILICQFGYMNWIAVPRFQSIVWDVSWEYQDEVMPPALVFILYSENVKLRPGHCNLLEPSGQDTDCNDSMRWNVSIDNPGFGGPGAYNLFDPKHSRLALKRGSSMRLQLPVQC
jgi:hypothetical protein